MSGFMGIGITSITKFGIFLFLASMFFAASALSASVSARSATFYGTGGNIETLAGSNSGKSAFVSPVPFELSKFATRDSTIRGTLKETVRGEQANYTGSVTIFAKGMYSGIGTAHYLDSSLKSNVKMTAYAKFTAKNSFCTSFSATHIACTTSSSRVYVFIPSHENLRFFYVYPKTFTIEIKDDKISVFAGNVLPDDVMKITDYGMTKWNFRQ